MGSIILVNVVHLKSKRTDEGRDSLNGNDKSEKMLLVFTNAKEEINKLEKYDHRQKVKNSVHFVSNV